MAKFCSNCGKQIVDESNRFCTNCGAPQPVPEFAGAAAPQQSAQSQQPTQPQAQPQQPQYQQTQQAQFNGQAQYGQPQYQQYSQPQYQQGVPYVPPVNTNFNQPPKKKSGGKKVGIAVIAICLVAALIAGIVAAAKIFTKGGGIGAIGGNYYQQVEKKSLNEFCDTFNEYYGGYLIDNFVKDSKYNVKFDLNLSDDLKSSLTKEANDFDLTWLDSTSFDITVTTNGSKTQSDTIISIDNQQVLSTVLFANPETNRLLLGLSEITDDILKFDLDTGEVGELDKQVLSQALPDSSKITSLIKKYYNIYLDSVTDFEKTEEVMEIDGISEKLTVITVNLTEKQVKEISTKILEELKADTEVKGIFDKAQKALEENKLYDEAEDMYDSFVKSIDDEMSEIASGESEEKIALTIYDYVNSKGEVVGRKIGDNGEKMNYLTVESDNKFASFADFQNGSSFEESGTKQGDRVTSECVFVSDDGSVFKLSLTDFDKSALKKGKLDGKVRFYPDSDAVEEIAPDAIGSYAGLFDLDFDIEINGNSDSGTFKMTVYNGEKALFEADAKYSISGGEDLVEPKGKVVDIEGLDSLSEITGDLHLDKLVENLRKTSFPKEYIDYIDEIAKQLATAE